MKFSISQFEHHCYRHEHEKASRMLLELLNKIDQNYGVLMDVDTWAQSGEARDIMDEHLLTRLTSAVTALVTDPGFTISDMGIKRLMLFQRWLAAMFAASPFRNADHILRSFGVDEDARNAITLRNNEFRKFQLFYLPESEVRLDWDVLWKHDKVTAASLATTIMSSRFLGTPSAHQKREMLLRWLPERLAEVDNVDALPMGVLHDMYMHCSYADLPGKHDIKKPINTLIRRKLASLGIHDVKRPAVKAAAGEKPVVIVVLEWFSKNHSIFRTHSQTMAAMRDRFHLVGMGYNGRVDEGGKAVFHEFIPLEGANLWDTARQVSTVSDERQAQMMYMPSVGMFPHTIFMTNVRVAPLQIAALGHPATMHAGCIDYVSVEEDFVGDPACFSEKLMRLPKDGQPYVPSKLLTDIAPSVPERGDYLNIAVTASAMKLNPRFLDACRQIIETAGIPVRFHFMTSWAEGLDIAYVRRLVESALPRSNVLVYGGLSYSAYLKVINVMDMFVSPFPFGNTNGIVDAFTLGLPGVNLCGREVFEHIDSGLFERAGMPAWLTAHSIDEYVRAAVRLATRHDEREALRRQMIGKKAVERIFEGRPEAFGRHVLALINAQMQTRAKPRPGTQTNGKSRTRST